MLKDTILLTKWDNKNDKDKKLEIIDEIMSGKSDFDSYKYEVLNDNGIITEQEHLLFKDYSPGPGDSDSVTLQVKGEDHTPYNIYEGEKEINLVAAPTGTVPSPSMLAEEEVIKQFGNTNHAHIPLETSPSDSIDEDMDKDLFDLLIGFVNRNSTVLLVLAILVTICIIGFLYKKSGKLIFFN